MDWGWGCVVGNDDDVSRLLPLKPVLFWILLVLVDGASHGYGILKEIEGRTDGAIRLEPGNLYRFLRRLLDDGLIQELDEAPEEDADTRRRYYDLTERGRATVRAEAERMRDLVQAAQSRDLIEGSGAGA